MWTDALHALVTAWVFALLLAVARTMPRRADGKAAITSTVASLFILTWAGGVWLRPWFTFDPGRAFPFAFAGLLSAMVVATLSLPVGRQRGDPRTRAPLDRPPPRLSMTWLWPLVGVAGVAIVAYYWGVAAEVV